MLLPLRMAVDDRHTRLISLDKTLILGSWTGTSMAF
jgi:hypothetical protein